MDFIPMLHPILQLMRLDKPIGIWLLLLPCWWGVLAYSDGMPWATLTLFALGAVAMRSAGCVVNDMADRDIDARISRTKSRPLASRALTMKHAYAVLALLLLVAFSVAVALGWKIVALGALWLPLVAAYPFMKRWTWWPQAFLGLTFGAGALFGMVAMTGGVHLTGLLLYAATFFWVIGYDTIYACQDRDEDARIGVKSTARLFGSRVREGVAVCYGLSAVLLIAAFITSDVAATGERARALPLLATMMLLGWQVRRFHPHNAAGCAHLFRVNIWVGMLVCLVYI
jgi:4-hydroxybenzoate polyprenyltransferase